MEEYKWRKNNGGRFLASLAIFCACVCISATLVSESKYMLDFKAGNKWFKINKIEERVGARTLLRGPGSWPPRCTSKCSRCTPCKAVQVAVPPGMPVTTEYYPEAWRCKCGNKLYMP